MQRRITILGSTGSIGTSTLDVLEHLGGDYKVVGLAAGSNWHDLADQVRRFAPEAAAISDEVAGERLTAAVGDRTRVLVGTDALVNIVQQTNCDTVVAAVVGAAGLPATLAAIEAGKTLALANKEALVVAGSLIVPRLAGTGARLLPIDSEHSAVFQAVQAGRAADVARVYLTASGGPFRSWPSERIAGATVEDALHHPTWDMGPKITIDSATQMNKALEIIEARWLFGLDPDQIEVLIHPESIIHSMVEFCDGSIVAQLGTPDMRTPIQYALTYPDRRPGRSERLDWTALRELTFEPPDPERFPALRLGHEVARTGGTAGAVFNAANEQAVQAFRDGHIPFGRIVELVEEVLRRQKPPSDPTLDELLAADRWARDEVSKCLNLQRA
jgi:1-deoxy-D-xylulose-5-phosphate reductoisomerase